MSRKRHTRRRWPGPDFLRADWLVIVLSLATILAVGAWLIYELFVALELFLRVEPRRPP